MIDRDYLDELSELLSDTPDKKNQNLVESDTTDSFPSIKTDDEESEHMLLLSSDTIDKLEKEIIREKKDTQPNQDLTHL